MPTKTTLSFCRISYPIFFILRSSINRTATSISSSATHLFGNENSCLTTTAPGPGNWVPITAETKPFKSAPWTHRCSDGQHSEWTKFVSPLTSANRSTSSWDTKRRTLTSVGRVQKTRSVLCLIICELLEKQCRNIFEWNKWIFFCQFHSRNVFGRINQQTNVFIVQLNESCDCFLNDVDFRMSQ